LSRVIVRFFHFAELWWFFAELMVLFAELEAVFAEMPAIFAESQVFNRKLLALYCGIKLILKRKAPEIHLRELFTIRLSLY
jgi:hypothetical protein